MLGEGFCRAVLEPLKPALQPPAVLAEAEAWFTKKIEHAELAGDEATRRLALLGRARVRLNRGNGAGAVSDATQIPAGFRVDASRGTAERQNRIYAETWRTRDMTVHPSFWNLEVDGVPDPRVVVSDRGHLGVDGVTPSWFPVNKAVAETSPIRMASWEEAQLIIAEVNLGQDAVGRINALRDIHGLPHYIPQNVSDGDEILDQILEERRREFFLEGRWLNDMIRHRGREVTAFDEGMNHQNITNYRDLYCIPLPEREIDNNPNVPS